MAIVDTKNALNLKSLGTFNKKLKYEGSHLYTEDEINEFDIREAINNSVLARRPLSVRSHLAYQVILKETKPTSKYLLPGQIVLFNYKQPKFAEDLQYYDATPLTLFFGITRTKDNTIREIGFNLHYYPPFARLNVLNTIYTIFKRHFDDVFNEASDKPYPIISYNKLMAIIKRNAKIAFGVRMYVPVLRGNSYVLPTRLLPISFYTEGHFAKATLFEIQRFWRRF